MSPEVSVITNIGFDHMQFLGNTLDKIAAEKAGIIKKHVPVVIGEKHQETEHVFTDRAKQLDAPIFFEWGDEQTPTSNYEVKNIDFIDSVAGENQIISVCYKNVDKMNKNLFP